MWHLVEITGRSMSNFRLALNSVGVEPELKTTIYKPCSQGEILPRGYKYKGYEYIGYTQATYTHNMYSGSFRQFCFPMSLNIYIFFGTNGKRNGKTNECIVWVCLDKNCVYLTRLCDWTQKFLTTVGFEIRKKSLFIFFVERHDS